MTSSKFVLYSRDMQEMVFFTVYGGRKDSTEPYWVGIRYLSTDGGTFMYKRNFKFSVNEVNLVVEEARGLWYYLLDKDWVYLSESTHLDETHLSARHV